MSEKMNGRPYIIRTCGVMDFICGGHREIQERNYSLNRTFVEKMLEKSKNGKLKPMETLDHETLYDLHSAFLPLYASLAQIYNISKRKVGYIFQKKEISTTGASRYNIMQYGIREIDVDKFVEYLSEE